MEASALRGKEGNCFPHPCGWELGGGVRGEGMGLGSEQTQPR